MTFDDFLAEFKTAYLPKDWEEITRIELLQLMQGEDSFWNFSILVQVKNSTLSGTQSHLSKMQLHHRMESGINATLALCCRLEKVTFTGNLTKWLDDVKCVDGLINAEQANFQALAKKSRETSRCTNSLAEPPRRTNTTTNVPAANHISLPKLTSVEHQLLYDNEGCLKCRRVFVPHRSTDCPNDFPDSANYKLLTQLFVDMIKRRVKKTVAAVVSSSTNEEAAASSASALVAVVMGMLSNLTAYTASNLMNVIEGDSLSDESVSKVPKRLFAAPAVPPVMRVASMLKASQEDMAPLTVPHLYWKCAVNGVDNEFPVTLQALIDHGADTVFINDRFASELALKRRKLLQPMSVEMAMPGDGHKQVVHMSQWVKLQLYDPVWGGNPRPSAPSSHHLFVHL